MSSLPGRPRHSFASVLVANRGEIAVRIIKTLHAMGIRSIAVYSDADAGAAHVRLADLAVRIGPAPAHDSYLNIDALAAAISATGAEAVHPGYGFLSENAEFARAVAAAGAVFIGPGPHAIAVMGDKITAKETVARAGVPVVPGVAGPALTDASLIAAAESVGYPLLIKPSAGGGGKGMRLVQQPADLPGALASARREAAAAFADDTLFIERYLSRPRHIEVQILADQHGNIRHLGERECSVQRRHQKVLEEAPSPLLDSAARARIGDAACATAGSVGYTGAGTVEFIVSADDPDRFYFMEMNTRLQVEHPVTELVTEIDLVEWQIRLAAGERLPMAQNEIRLHGHAIEARVYAEDPSREFVPASGPVLAYHEPAGVRVDSGIVAGNVVGTEYDPMLAKIIAYGPDRDTALARLGQALAETIVHGVVTNLGFLRFLLTDADLAAGDLDTGLLDRRAGDYRPPHGTELIAAAATCTWLQRWERANGQLWDQPGGWRLGAAAPWVIRLGMRDHSARIALTGQPDSATITIDESEPQTVTAQLTGDGVWLAIGDRPGARYIVTPGDNQIWVSGPAGTVAVRELTATAPRTSHAAAHDGEIVSPMPGSVISVLVTDGAQVHRDDPVAVVEAMKMEHTVRSSADGIIQILVSAGDQVSVDQPLARVRAAGPVNE